MPPGYWGKATKPKVPLFQLPLCGSLLQRGMYGFVGEEELVTSFFHRLWAEDEGQDVAEYAVMLAVILVIVVGTVKLIGGNSNNVFSSVASAIGS
jgi:Flp pilus assembly pilin Flp